MNILLAAHQISVGGIGTLTRGLATALPDALSTDDHLAVAGYCPGLGRWPNVEYIRVPRGLRSRLGRPVYEQTRLAATARRADLVHLTDPRPILVSRRPFVMTVHDVFFLDHPEWYPPAVRAYKRALLAAAIAKRPRAIVCASGYTRERLLAHHEPHPDTRVEVIHAGVASQPQLAPVPAAAHPYFLTVSAIEPRKNHLLLLEAFRLARSRGLSLGWKVAGSQGYRSRRIIEALRREPGVDFLGLVSDEERDRLYGAALFCAFASHGEGFGFPPLEAMSLNRPVICSTGTALDETVGQAALRIASTDVEGWADALLALESDGELRDRLAETGRRTAAAFTWTEAAARHVECYRVAVAGKHL